MQPEHISEKLDAAGITHEIKKRTLKQNASYWKWLTMLAESLNDAGFSFNDKIVIKCDVPFTKDNLHEAACKAFITALWPDKDSSTQLSTVEEQELYKFVDQAISSRTGCHIEWPDRHGD